MINAVTLHGLHLYFLASIYFILGPMMRPQLKKSLKYIFLKMSSETFFTNSLKKLGKIIGKLDTKLGIYSDFGKKYSSEPNFPELQKDLAKANVSEVKGEIKKEDFISTPIIPEAKAKEETNDEKTEKLAKKDAKEPKEGKKEKKEAKKEKEQTEKTEQPKEGAKQESKESNTKKLQDTFNDIDFRVAKVVKIQNMEGSENLYHCWVDVGEGSIREIGCGLRKYGVPMEEFTKKPILVFANLKPKKLANIMSNGMILCCSKDEKEFELIRPHDESQPGESVYLEGANPRTSPAEFLSANKFGKAVPLLRSTDDLIASYGGIKLRTEKGFISVPTLKNSPIS